MDLNSDVFTRIVQKYLGIIKNDRDPYRHPTLINNLSSLSKTTLISDF